MVLSLSVAIPTYKREDVLINTIEALFKQRREIRQIFVIDQTPQHGSNVEKTLEEWNEKGLICWMRCLNPSIPAAMNLALLNAESDVVLFLDDDIIPSEELLNGHLTAYLEHRDIWAVAGRVVQPWHLSTVGDELKESQIDSQTEFRFNSKKKQYVKEVMAGNLSVLRQKALEIGGFDENFIGVGYRFETEFAERLIQKGGKIFFEPSASIFHLKAVEGGTRSFGHFLKTFLPYHSVGAYYYILHSKKMKPIMKSIFIRFFRSICTKHHLSKPWWIPATLTAEILGMVWALILAVKGPRYIKA